MESVDPNIRFPRSDQDGPEHSPFRLWEKSATKLNFQEAEERQRILQMSEQSMKNPGQAQLDAIGKRLMSGGETTAGITGLSAHEMAQHMAASGHGGGRSSGAFISGGVDVGPDVARLLPQEEDEDEDEDEDGKEDKEQEADCGDEDDDVDVDSLKSS